MASVLTRCVEDEEAKRLGEVGVFLSIPASEVTILEKIGDPGRLLHQGLKLTEGYRINLVIWTTR